MDAAAKMAAKRERSEGDLLQSMEVAEQNNWRSLVTVRHSVVKYRTMSKVVPAGCSPPGSSTCMLKHCFSSQMASYDAASNTSALLK